MMCVCDSWSRFVVASCACGMLLREMLKDEMVCFWVL